MKADAARALSDPGAGLPQWSAQDDPAPGTRSLLQPLLPAPDHEVVFVSPGGLWGPAVLDKIAVAQRTRAARLSIAAPAGAAAGSCGEYVDAVLRGLGRVRAFAVEPDANGLAIVRAFGRSIQLVVWLLTPSGLVGLAPQLEVWRRALGAGGRGPRQLILSGAATERVRPLLGESPVELVEARPSAGAEVWQLTQTLLLQSLPAAVPAAPAEPADPLCDATWALEGVILVQRLRADPPSGAGDSRLLDIDGLATAIAGSGRQPPAEVIVTTGRHWVLWRPAPDGDGACVVIADRGATTLAAIRLRLDGLWAAAPGLDLELPG